MQCTASRLVQHAFKPLPLPLCLQLDLSQPLEEQGPLDVIIHKLTDLILEADQNDTQSLLLVQHVQVRTGHGTVSHHALHLLLNPGLAANHFSY